MTRHLVLPLLACLAATPAPAADCRLALVLAMDVSRSVDARDFAIQAQGLADALMAPEVEVAFFAPAGDVALSIYLWSGEDHQEIILPWTLIDAPEDLAPVAAMLRALPRPDMRLPTALGRALAFGRGLLDSAPDCGRRVIDMAGDGRNNSGPTPARIYATGGWDGITVNGLPIGAHELMVADYYATEVIRGPGAFVEVANRQEDFPAAMRRKLLRELTQALSSLQGAAPAPPPWKS